MGKSVLASQLCTVASAKEVLAACFFFQHHKARRNNPKILVQTLAHQLCFSIPQFKDKIERYLNEETIVQMNVFELFTDLVLEPLHSAAKVPKPKLIIIDGLDECDFEERDELFKLILREFVKLPEWMRVIMTTRPDQKILRKLTRIKTVFELNPNDPRNINDIKIYLRDILKERMQIEDLESGLEIMVKKSEGMFLYFHYASEAILQQDTLTVDDLNTLLPDGIDDFYEQNFRRLYQKLGEEKYQLLFQAITAARSEFPQALIGPLLNVSDAESKQIIDTVSVLLPVHNGYVNVFHKSVRDWLTDRDLAEDLVIDSTLGHSKVADVCYKEFQNIKLIAPQETEIVQNRVAKYVIEHAAYHLYSANSHLLEENLCSIVTDLQYMFYKLLLSRSAKDLLDDLSEAKKVVSGSSVHRQKLQPCIRFVTRYAQTLRSMPQMAFQCALNDPQGAAIHLGLEQYRHNPAQLFPGLELYLELINKPQSLASAITEYHCENDITSLTTSPDGKLLICSDSEGKMYIWDKYTGDLLQEEVIEGRNFLFPIIQCSVSPDGKIILCGNLAEALSIDGFTVPFFANATSDPSKINTCIFSPNGQYVAAWNYCIDGYFRLLAEIGMNDGKEKFAVQIWDRDQEVSITLEEVTRKEVRPLCMCFSSDSKYIACGHRDGRIMLWETGTKNPKGMLLTDGTTVRIGPFKPMGPPKDDPIHEIAYSLNGHYLIASHNKAVTIWDAASLNFVQNLIPSNDMFKMFPNFKFRSCSFSPDSKNIVAGLSNGYIHVWTKQPSPEGVYAFQLSIKPHGSSDPVLACYFDDDRKIVCAVRSSICIYAYDTLLNTRPSTESIAIHPTYSTNCAILPNGKTALTCGNRSICSWNVPHACQISSTQNTVSGHLMELSADGKLALTFGEGSLIQLWETETLNKKTSVRSLGPSTNQSDPDSSSPQDICSCAVSINGTVVGGTGEGDVYVWYGENNSSFKVLKQHEALITSMAFSSEGDRFVSGDMDGCITMWKLAMQTQERVDIIKVPMQAHGDSAEQVLFSPGQLQRIVSCGSDKMIHLYNGLTGELINQMAGHSSDVLKIAYSASGELLVSGDGKGQLILWDGFTGRLVQKFYPFSGHVILNLQFSGEDKYVCSRDSHQDFVQVYSVSSGRCVSQIDFSSPISSFAASSLKEESQSHMVCGLKNGSVQFLRLANSRQATKKSSGILTPMNHELIK